MRNRILFTLLSIMFLLLNTSVCYSFIPFNSAPFSTKIPATTDSNFSDDKPALFLTATAYPGKTDYSQYPPAKVVDNFDGTSDVVFTWWDIDGDKVYKREFVDDIYRSGNSSMKVYFKKTDRNLAWSFFAFQPQQDDIHNDFSKYDKLIFWLYVPKTYKNQPLGLIVKFEDKNGGAFEKKFEFQPKKEWQLVEFDFSDAKGIDLTQIDNVLFFADGGKVPTAGRFWMDDIYLLDSGYTPEDTPAKPTIEGIKEEFGITQLTWSDESVSGAILYEVQYSNSPDFSDAVSIWTNNNYLNLEDIKKPGNYYYRVRSWNHLPEYEGKASDWSEVFKYHIANLPPKIGEVSSFVASDTDNSYSVGSIARVLVVVEEQDVEDIVEATVRIRSPATGYDSGLQELSLSEDGSYWFWHWNTFGLKPADDYQVTFTFKDSEGHITTNKDLIIELTPSVPLLISRLSQTQDTDFRGEGVFLPFTRVYDYQLEESNRLELGKGWIHTYGSYLKEYADGSVEIVWSDGEFDFYTKENNKYVNIKPSQYPKLIKQNGEFIVYKRDGQKYKFDSEGRLTNITRANGTSLDIYHYKGHLFKVYDRVTDKYLQFEYTNDRLTEIITPSGKKVNFEYENQRLSKVIDLFGRITKYEYNSDGKLSKIIHPDGKITYFEYNEEGRLKSVSNNNGINKVSYTYSHLDYSVTVKDALGHTTKYIYNSMGQPIQRIDPLGNSTYYSYDNSGNLIQLTDQRGNITRFQYDEFGNVTKIIDAKGNTLSVAYNDFNRPISITDPNGNTTQFNYDKFGNVTSIIDAKGNTTTFSYDENGFLIKKDGPSTAPVKFNYSKEGLLDKIIDPLGNVTNFEYDIFGRLIQLTDANLNKTNFEFEGANLISKTDALGDKVEYRYDEFGNLISLIDSQGQSINYEYDKVGRLTKVTFSDNTSIQYGYDKVGNLISKTDRAGNTINYKYDALGRLIQKQYPDGKIIDYKYDAAGNITEIKSSDGTIEYSYNSLNQKINSIDRFGNQISYQYDPAGNIKKLTYPDGSSLTYNYDENNQLIEIIDNSNQDTFRFEYDKEGRITKLVRSNGVITDYKYDDAGRLIKLIHRDSSGNKIAEFNYTLDNVGNIVGINTLEGEYNYNYDRLYQLTGFKYPNKDIKYSYDTVGNRDSVKIDSNVIDYTSNPLYQYTEVGNIQYEYDENGNVIRKITPEGITVYEYDYDNRLTKVALPDGKEVQYKYDALGRRVQKIVDGKVTNYIYNGWQVIAETDAEGNIKAKYIYGNGLDNVLSMRKDGKSYYYLQDGIGNVIAITDREGNVVEEYEYLPFGDVVIRNEDGNELDSSLIGNPYYFTGRRLDQESGLYYFRHRYYDFRIGRFISPEPQPVITQENLYTYAFNNPVNFVDRLGLCKFPPKAPSDVPTDPQSSDVNPTTVQTACISPGGVIGGTITGTIGGAISGGIAGARARGFQGAIAGARAGAMAGAIAGTIGGAINTIIGGTLGIIAGQIVGTIVGETINPDIAK